MLHEFTTEAGSLWADLTRIYVVQPAGPVSAKIVLANGMEYTVLESAGTVADLVREAHKAANLRRRAQPESF